MKLRLLRHAKVQVAKGLCYGATDLQSDPDHTRDTAQRLAPQLRANTQIVTSPLQRAAQLAHAIQRLRPDLIALEIDPRLREMDFGQWEMQPWDSMPKAACDAWTDDFAHHRFGGHESAQEVVDRVASALADMKQQTCEDILWVTHAGVIGAVQFLLAGQAQLLRTASDWPLSTVALGEWLDIEI